MFDKIKPGPFDVRYKVRPDRPKPEKTGVRPSLPYTRCRRKVVPPICAQNYGPTTLHIFIAPPPH